MSDDKTEPDVLDEPLPPGEAFRILERPHHFVALTPDASLVAGHLREGGTVGERG